MITKVAVIVLLCGIVVGTFAFSLQDCDLPKCVHKNVGCKILCASNGMKSSACMTCLKDFNNTCNRCDTKEPTRYSIGSNFNNKAPTAHIEGCSFLDGLACAAVVAGCGVVCAAAEIDAPACIACCGGSYSTCKDCF